MLRSVGPFALALSALAVAGCATTGKQAAPGHSASDSFVDLRGKVEKSVADGRFPGAVFAIARGARVLDLEAVGLANLDTKTPMRADSIFRTMSMTKPVTAVAAMIMVEQGKLKLDAPVADVLPEFAAFGVPGAPPLTLRHLLTHTSGIGFGSILTNPTTLEVRAKEAAARSRTVPAGKEWAYSGFEGPDIVARMVEVAAGEPYELFIKRRVFAPLGMKDTTYKLTDEQQRRLVGLYAAKDGKVTTASSPFPQLDVPSGGAGLFSTVPDYLRLAQMLAGDGTLDGTRILSAASVNELRRAQIPAGFPGLLPGADFGLLMRRVADPVTAKSPLPVGAFGWSGAYGTHFWVDPATGLSAVWMVNLTTAGGAGSPDALAFEHMVMEACSVDTRCSR